VALTKVLCARAFEIEPTFEAAEPDLTAMLARCDAALIIGDLALLSEGGKNVEKIDLGDVWTRHTGLPFVFAFWAGRAGALSSDEVRSLQEARDAGVASSAQVARDYFADPALQAIAVRYLRDNISYHLGERELVGLKMFYRYAAELGLAPEGREPRFY
jgi:chorismate dehydratase